MAKRRNIFYLGLSILYCLSVCEGVYLTSIYAMDPSVSRTFGGYCGEVIKDDCLWITSGLNVFGLSNYGNDVDCVLTLDAGTSANRYRFIVQNWAMQTSTNCQSDYLEIYDSFYNTSFPTQNLLGRYCTNSPNFTIIPTEQVVAFKFHTDSAQVANGFKILATKTSPVPCDITEEFECVNDSICINSGLKCDGTPQCSNGMDELGCSGWDNFVGSILRLGLVDMIAVGVIIVGSLIFIGVIGCILCCCLCGKKKKRTSVSPTLDPTPPIVVNINTGNADSGKSVTVTTENENEQKDADNDTDKSETGDNNKTEAKENANQTAVTTTEDDGGNKTDETKSDEANTTSNSDNMNTTESQEVTQKQDGDNIDPKAVVVLEEDNINSELEQALQTDINGDGDIQSNEEVKPKGNEETNDDVRKQDDTLQEDDIDPEEDAKTVVDSKEDVNTTLTEDTKPDGTTEDEVKQNNAQPNEETQEDDSQPNEEPRQDEAQPNEETQQDDAKTDDGTNLNEEIKSDQDTKLDLTTKENGDTHLNEQTKAESNQASQEPINEKDNIDQANETEKSETINGDTDTKAVMDIAESAAKTLETSQTYAEETNGLPNIA